MSRGLTPPELERELGKLKRRVSDLERILRNVAENTDDPEAVFSLSGEVFEAGESGPWRKQRGGRLVQVLAGVLVPGDFDVDLLVKKNGFTFDTLTLPAGAVVAALTVSQVYGPDSDYLSVEPVLPDGATGDPPQDLVVQARWRPAGRAA